jgi:hypothetical protein
VTAWWTGIAPAEASVQCGGHTHRLRWEAGRLLAPDHGDLEDEATLAALAGESFACLELLHDWRRRANDPRVLTLGSRGPSDRVGEDDHGRSGLVARSMSGASAAGAFTTIGQIRGGAVTPGGQPRLRPEEQLARLLALGGGLPLRLQATVAAAWARRLATGHRALADTRAQLHAALYGRVLLTLRTWLGEPELAIELALGEPDGPRTLTRTGDGIAVRLPFAWLVEVWAREVAIVAGRLCLAAAPDEARGGWRLTTLAPDLATLETLELTLATA